MSLRRHCGGGSQRMGSNGRVPGPDYHLPVVWEEIQSRD